MLKLNGIFPPLPTPFNHEGELYMAKIRHNVEKWNRVALAGYVVCSEAGEAELLSEEEKVRVWEAVAKSCAPGRVLIAATFANSVRETVGLIKKAAEHNYSCALVRAPRLAHTNSLLYFQAVADQARLPLLLALRPEDRIPAGHPNIAALSSDTPDMAYIQELLGEGLPVLTACTENYYLSLMAGASGAILDYAAAAPFSCITIQEAVQKREYEAAKDWQQRIRKAAELIRRQYGVPGLKYALDFNGYYGGPARLPYAPLPRAAQEAIEAALHGLRG